jgi:serine/threonine protein kinase
MWQDSATWRGGSEGGGLARRLTLCGWTVERTLGRGRVCESFLVARGGHRAVARTLRPSFASDEAARADWLRASWTANRFQHPRVARVLEQGADAEGEPIILRAWAEGATLAHVTAHGTSEVLVTLGLIEQVLDALEIAHAHGILHAGISPSNIIVNERRGVRVVDFGHHGSDRIASGRVGPFSAPERREEQAAPPSEAADIWSVGACLRFALGATPAPPDVEAVIAVATAGDPRERYESAYAMLGDVRRLLSGRKPKLRSSIAPVPSESHAALPSARLVPDAGTLRSGLDVREPTALQGPSTTSREWIGNVLLMIAIAFLAGLASFVLVRERIAEEQRHAPATSQPR